jgi:hypothetical protein
MLRTPDLSALPPQNPEHSGATGKINNSENAAEALKGNGFRKRFSGGEATK